MAIFQQLSRAAVANPRRAALNEGVHLISPLATHAGIARLQIDHSDTSQPLPAKRSRRPAFWTRKMNESREQERTLESELSRLSAQLTTESVLTMQRLFELAQTAHCLYLTRNVAERGQLLKSVLLNCSTDGVSLCPTYRKPFDLIFERAKTENWSGRADLNCTGPSQGFYLCASASLLRISLGVLAVGSNRPLPTPTFFSVKRREMVGTGRFELPTPRTPSECSTRLSHVPTIGRTAA
jgi:hypothetical protein